MATGKMRGTLLESQFSDQSANWLEPLHTGRLSASNPSIYSWSEKIIVP